MESGELTTQIESLKTKLTGNMMEDMEIRDQIHNLEMKLKGVKPEDSHFDCIGCGSKQLLQLRFYLDPHFKNIGFLIC